MVEDTIEVFMDNFSVVSDSFEDFLMHLHAMLRRSEKCHLVLNWKKYHFMMKEALH